MNRKYAGFSRGKGNLKIFLNSFQLFFLLFTFGASTLISTSTYAAGYDCYMVRPCWWDGATSTLTCGVVHTFCRYIPDAPAPPNTPPPPTPYTPPPVSSLTPEERRAYCDASSYEVSADRQSCDAGVVLVSGANGYNCSSKGTIKWDYSFSGARFSTNFSSSYSYSDSNSCLGMNASFSNYARSQCAAQENRARGNAVGICGPIQW